MMIDLQRYSDYWTIRHPAELAARIIQTMSEHGSVTLINKEVRDIEQNGLITFLDELCEWHQWDKNSIGIELTDPYVIKRIQSSGYRFIVPRERGHEPLAGFALHKIQHRVWNQEKIYGMFLGRANLTRMYAAYLHQKFEYRQHGLTSFNTNLETDVDEVYIRQYLCETNQRWHDVKTQLHPWSDIDRIQQPPIVNQKYGGIWNDVYQRIAIEIVCETAENDIAGVTEKLLRPMFYKRPFLVIAGKDFLYKLRNYHRDFPSLTQLDHYPWTSLRYFENVFDFDYDREQGISRVECVFDMLRNIIRSGKIKTLLKDCESDIEHNYNTLVGMATSHTEKLKDWNKDFETQTWHLR